MNWIQNDYQNVVNQHPKAWQSYYIVICDILFHNATVSMLFYVRWSCLYVEASVVSVSSSLVFLWKFCTEDVY